MFFLLPLVSCCFWPYIIVYCNNEPFLNIMSYSLHYQSQHVATLNNTQSLFFSFVYKLNNPNGTLEAHLLTCNVFYKLFFWLWWHTNGCQSDSKSVFVIDNLPICVVVIINHKIYEESLEAAKGWFLFRRFSFVITAGQELVSDLLNCLCAAFVLRVLILCLSW